MVASDDKRAPRPYPPGAVCSLALPPEPELLRVLDEDGNEVAPLPDISDEVLAKIHHHMLLVRLLDERMMILQRQGRVGFYGACTGQEAPPVATAAALRETDWIFPGLREGAAMLYRGFSLEAYVCQVFGNSGDVTRGRQMPSHYAARSANYVSWGSCIGTQITHAVGAAWAAKLKGTSDITVAFMGDGATSSSDFHSGMNFAGVFQVPCVLICQNNHWSISVPTKGQTRSRTIAEKAVGYGIPYARVDGNDALAVYAAVSEASERARNGGGPSFLELLTYRIGAHSSSDDPRVYRDESEVEVWKAKDPLSRFEKFLTTQGLLNPEQQASRREALRAEIMTVVEAAEQRPPLPPASMFEDVYAVPTWGLSEQSEEHLHGSHKG